MRILTLNCGSSSIKFQLVDSAQRLSLAEGLLSEVGSPRAAFRWRAADGQEESRPLPGIDYEQGIARVLAVLGLGPESGDPTGVDGVGHRVVHGGERFTAATLVDDAVEAQIEEMIPLAPLHNPANLSGIRICRRLLPGVPQAAVFDTAFHQTMPEPAYLYALPIHLYQQHGVRRYGFHGSSHRYVSRRAARIMGGSGRLITLHLGNGASAAAIRDGRSVDTSMGMTPLEGLVMGTRSGDLDPSLVGLIGQMTGRDPAGVEQMLLRESGLLGLSALSSDMRELEAAAAAGDPAAQRALAVYSYRARKYVGAYAAALGGLDALVFTGGVGENSAPMRAAICEGLEFLGVRLDEAANQAATGERAIHAVGSGVVILVIPTNEELMIALDTSRLIQEASG